jgi:hypothetical protein
MTEMEKLQKKNQMLNFFVDRRKKKKPTAMQKAKMMALKKLKDKKTHSKGEKKDHSTE